jgi:hypothetical protein
LKEIRNHHPTIPVFFYIGDIPKANKKLADNKVDLSNIMVGKSAK